MIQHRWNGRCCSLCVSSPLFPGTARPEEAAGPEPGWAVGWGGHGDLAVPVSPRPPPAHSRRALLYAHKSLGKHYRSTGDLQGWLRVPGKARAWFAGRLRRGGAKAASLGRVWAGLVNSSCHGVFGSSSPAPPSPVTGHQEEFP